MKALAHYRQPIMTESLCRQKAGCFGSEMSAAISQLQNSTLKSPPPPQYTSQLDFNFPTFFALASLSKTVESLSREVFKECADVALEGIV